MEAGGNDLKEFLVNLPLFIIGYANLSKLTPPEFLKDITENSINLHYFQKRGTSGFCQGLIQGGKNV
jgi:uncharacterized membrane-anchored protein YitT (DUF2179 family)